MKGYGIIELASLKNVLSDNETFLLESCLYCKACVEPLTPPLGKCTIIIKDNCMMMQHTGRPMPGSNHCMCVSSTFK